MDGAQFEKMIEGIRNDRSTVKITGGIFTTDPSEWVDTTKYTVTDNSDGTWTVAALDSET